MIWVNSSENDTRDEQVYNHLFNAKKTALIDKFTYLHRDDGTKIQTLALYFQGVRKGI